MQSMAVFLSCQKVMGLLTRQTPKCYQSRSLILVRALAFPRRKRYSSTLRSEWPCYLLLGMGNLISGHDSCRTDLFLVLEFAFMHRSELVPIRWGWWPLMCQPNHPTSESGGANSLQGDLVVFIPLLPSSSLVAPSVPYFLLLVVGFFYSMFPIPIFVSLVLCWADIWISIDWWSMLQRLTLRPETDTRWLGGLFSPPPLFPFDILFFA